MKMTAEEIVAAYKADSSKANMQMLAELNGCSLKEIGEFLQNAAKKRKPGRPKKLSSEATKRNKNQNLSNKVESLPEEKRAKKYLIPPILESISKEKIEEYRRTAEIHRNKAAELEIQANELQDFLNGGGQNGD